MLFQPKADLDQSQRIIVDISTIGKQSRTQLTRVFMDFKIDPLLRFVENTGTLYGRNPVTGENTAWNDFEELGIILRDYRTHEFTRGDASLTLRGLCSVDYDLPTCSLWVKSNSLGTLQSTEPQMLYSNYLSYMLVYRMLKHLDEKGEQSKPNANGKTKNYYLKEHNLFKMGYMPIALFSKSEAPELKQSIMNAIESTPLMEGMLTESAYNVRGGAIEDYQMIWVTKRAAYKFLESVRPGTYEMYGYQALTLKVVLFTLLEYAGLLSREFFEAETGQILPQLPNLQAIRFEMRADVNDLSLKRMEPVPV